MAPATDDDIITGVLAREGGYVNRPEDAGGPTRYGITLVTLAGWRGHEVTSADVAMLPESEARAIYRALYVHAPRFDQVPDMALRELLVDTGVTSGTRHAAEWLQKVLGVRQDGLIGSDTLTALAARPAGGIYLALCGLRMRIAGRLITSRPSQAVFAGGWFARIAQFVEGAPLS